MNAAEQAIHQILVKDEIIRKENISLELVKAIYSLLKCKGLSDEQIIKKSKIYSNKIAVIR